MRNIKKTLTEIFGYEVGREQRINILKEVKETQKDIREIAAKYIIPEMAILDDELKFNYRGNQITIAEWEKSNPLGPFGRITIIGRRDVIAKYRESKINT